MNPKENNMARTWKSKKDRREAAVAFLQQTITDPDLRSAVLKDRKAAHKLLEKAGDIDIPDDVEVICVGPSTQERDRLVVFVLPPEGTETDHLDAFKYWIGTWFPYGMDTMKVSGSHDQAVSEVPEPSLQ
jgi:hypothetical protein